MTATKRSQHRLQAMKRYVDRLFQGSSSQVSYGGLSSVAALLTAASMVLIVNAIFRQPGSIEHWIVNAVQGVSTVVVSSLIALASGLAGWMALAFGWLLLLGIAGLSRRWGLLFVTLSIPVFAALGAVFDQLIAGRPVPDSSALVRAVEGGSSSVFASAQVIATLLVYGLLFVVARDIRSRPVMLVVQSVSAIVIPFIGIAHLWTGALWPTDVLMAFVLGGLFLIPLIALAQRIDAACRDLPLVHAAEVLDDNSKEHARALTSTIVFNGETVSKVYRPGFLPRAIYWVAFQAEFPYMRNVSALRAAMHRRNMIGMLTEYWYGENMVARAVGIDRVAGRLAITSEYVDGSAPSDREAAREFLGGLVQHFDETGLPTWQIDPRQPRATDNVLETPDGSYRVVDLESGLVSPLASVRAWKRAIRRGLVPMYDEVFFDVTRAYVRQHDAAMRAKHGDTWMARLYSLLDAAERETLAWHDSEPRIWSRLLGRERRHDPSRVARAHWAVEWFDSAILRWRKEGIIQQSEADELRATVKSPQFIRVMPHFAVHLSTGVLLRFPLGSIARTAYTAFHLARSTWRYLRGRLSREDWRDSVGIHSPFVLLLAAIPGFGSFAYLASRPIRSHQTLLRVGLDELLMKLPWRMYRRSGIRPLITHTPGLVRNRSARRSTSRPMPMFSWAEEHRVADEVDQQPRSTAFADSIGARIIT